MLEKHNVHKIADFFYRQKCKCCVPKTSVIQRCNNLYIAVESFAQNIYNNFSSLSLYNFFLSAVFVLNLPPREIWRAHTIHAVDLAWKIFMEMTQAYPLNTKYKGINFLPHLLSLSHLFIYSTCYPHNPPTNHSPSHLSIQTHFTVSSKQVTFFIPLT